MEFKTGQNSEIYEDEKNKFEFPVNIRQIGCIDDKTKIYIEDYVYTYLYQYAKLDNYSEKLGILVGRHFSYDDYDVIIVSGAVQCKYTENQNGGEVFTDKSWNYVNEKIQIYFPNLDVVGWIHTLAGYGAVLMAKDEEMHRTYFNKPYHQLFVIDAEDKMDRIFSLNQDNKRMNESKGYFIYYDKNRSMQEYMLDNILVKPKENMINDINTSNVTNEQFQNDYNERLDAAKKIRSVLKEREEKVAERNRIRYRTLTSVCACLCIFCFVLGISLLNSSSRINKLETEVVSVKTKYLDISEQMQQNNVASVFAGEQNNSLDLNKNIQEKQQSNDVQEKQQSNDVQEKQQSNDVQVNQQSNDVQERQQSNDVQEKQQSNDVQEKQQSNDVQVNQQSNDVQVNQQNIYIVQEGDTLGQISTKIYGTVKMTDKIMSVNGITDPNKIIVGKKLILP